VFPTVNGSRCFFACAPFFLVQFFVVRGWLLNFGLFLYCSLLGREFDDLLVPDVNIFYQKVSENVSGFSRNLLFFAINI